MIDGVSRAVRRFAALGLLLMVVLMVGGLVVEPLVSRWSANSNRISTEHERLSHIRATLARSEATSPADLAVRQKSILAAHVEGRTEAQQLSTLQEALRSQAQKEGVRFLSLRALPSFERGGARFIGAQFSFTASLESAQRLIWQIEASRPFMLIDGLEISPASERVAQPNAGADVHLTMRLAAPVTTVDLAAAQRVEGPRQ